MQGFVIWRATGADKMASRVDFGIEINKGAYLGKPENQIKLVLTGLAHNFLEPVCRLH
ncbi:hypothetical protein SAMN06265373_1127 [Shimia sagamensis]|uniref:Transposase DDE domain-containing protein n=1 Tax=Shimia sagamensis TaxID=1566352 RepID=A0ABY1PJX3_9RHOB|nr:hypothetical protein SAMN06265373_1127 [Shimia sagamensis]